MSSTTARFRPIAGSMEPKKPVLSNALWDIIFWQKWAIISIGWSIFLIYLNLVEYTFGAELGTSGTQTANILGALQLAIKAHELTLACSLFVVAQQWLQRTLLDFDTGILFTENEIGGPSYLISKGYFAAVCYGGRSYGPRNGTTLEDLRRKRHVSLIAIFLFLACVITSLAGPASGVLMIPRVDWFLETVHYYYSNTPTNFPYLLVTQWSGTKQPIFHDLGFTPDPGLAYWRNFADKRTYGLGAVQA